MEARSQAAMRHFILLGLIWLACLARSGAAAAAVGACARLDDAACKPLPLSDSGHVRVRWSVVEQTITFDLEVDAAPGARGGACGVEGTAS